jgi:hypothetical protein
MDNPETLLNIKNIVHEHRIKVAFQCGGCSSNRFPNKRPQGEKMCVWVCLFDVFLKGK